MTLGWHLNRLRSMEPAEVLHRLGERVRRVRSCNRDEGWQRYEAPPLSRVFVDWRDRMRAATAPQRTAIREAAERYLSGEFEALGRSWPPREPNDLFPQEAWRLDPVSGESWPADAYCFDINFRHGGDLGDVKYVWEFNRLQMLPVLAAHLVLEGDKRSAGAIETAISSWHAANPPFRGVAWASGIEVALRAINLIVTLDIAGPSLTADTHRRVGEILTASAYWLPRFPSRFSSANNHLVAELAGEFLIARSLGADSSASQAALSQEVQRQILPDGAPAEQSPTYGAFTAELASLCVDAARQAGRPFAPAVMERLALFPDYVAWLGTTRFGDDDEGRALTPGQETDYSGSVAAAINGFLGRPGLSAPADDFRATIFGGPATIADTPLGLKTFPAGGTSIWRGRLGPRSVALTFDHGPLGYLSIAAHGHADALSITLEIDGRPVLVDPGTYLYGSGAAWRSWFRSTPAHNTLNVAGDSQSEMAGPFNWLRKASARLESSRPEPDWQLRGRHDGYLRRHGVTHDRTVTRDGNDIAITDRLVEGERSAEIVFQLAGGLTARRYGRDVTVLAGDEPLLLIQMPDDAVEIATGAADDVAGGWVSPRFGLNVPAPRLSWRGRVGEAGVVTRLRPLSKP
jgi:Heparinase II/III-like protein